LKDVYTHDELATVTHDKLKTRRSFSFGYVTPTTSDTVPYSEMAAIIADIQRRNKVRIEAHLPTLDLPAEISRSLARREAERYSAFRREWGEIVRAKALEKLRRWKGDPAWKPISLFQGGIELEIVSRRLMDRLYRRYGRHR
jgi:hypothetical protein